jgi:hypothetical protein
MLKIKASERLKTTALDLDYEARLRELSELIDEPDWGKITAASRLSASSPMEQTNSLLRKMGIDAELVHLTKDTALYELRTPKERVQKILTFRFGVPKIGKKGNVKMCVWDDWAPDIGIVMHELPDGKATLEIYDR